MEKENIWQWLKVLSLFDGMSCWMIALERAGIKVDTYYASEIDKYATQVSEKNYPNIVRLWDVNDWRDWDLWEIDLIIWWSPCQWFSFAWKQLAFDDPRSKLFFTMVDIINHFNPKYFLLENVKMKKEYQEIISEYMWVQPININSKLVSAQLRNRYYRTNIPWVEQPKDKWIILQSILENWYTDREKSRAILESESRPLVSKDRMRHRYKNTGFTTIVYENNTDDKYNIRYFTQTELERLQTIPDWYTSCLTRNKAASILGNWWTVDVIAHIFSYLKD